MWCDAFMLIVFATMSKRLIYPHPRRKPFSACVNSPFTAVTGMTFFRRRRFHTIQWECVSLYYYNIIMVCMVIYIFFFSRSGFAIPSVSRIRMPTYKNLVFLSVAFVTSKRNNNFIVIHTFYTYIYMYSIKYYNL